MEDRVDLKLGRAVLVTLFPESAKEGLVLSLIFLLMNIYIYFVFLGLHLWHMEVPRLKV